MELFFSLRGILISVLMLAGVATTLVYPITGLISIFALTFLRAGFLYEWFPALYDDMHLVQFAILLTTVAWLLNKKKYPFKANLDMGILVLFYGVICLSRLVNGIPVFENKVPDEYLRVMIVTFLCVQILKSPRDICTVLWAFVGIHLFLAIRAYWRYKTEGWGIALPDYFWVNRNGFANTLAFIFPIAYFLSKISRNMLLKFLGLGTAGWCIVGVILTYSRGGLLALLVSLFLILVHEKQKIILIIIGIILAVGIMPRLSEKYMSRISSIETYEEDASAMGRIATNYAAINMFKENPVFGVGAGNYNDIFWTYVPPDYLKWVAEGKSIHNIMMQVLSETGFIGIVLFCLMLLRAGLHTRVRRLEGISEMINIAYMLRIAFISILFGEQFGQGAYFGNIYAILPFIIAFRLLPNDSVQSRQGRIEGRQTSTCKKDNKNRNAKH